MANPENYDFTVEDHISGEVGERVRAIISAAETAASAIRHEAEEEAAARRRLAESERERYLESARHEAHELLQKRSARIRELSDSLIEGAERLLSQFDDAHDLRRELDRTVATLAEAAAALVSEERALRGSRPAPEPQAPEPQQPAEAPEAEHPIAAQHEAAVDAEVVEEPEEGTTDEGDEVAAARRLREAQAPAEAAGTNGAAERPAREDDDEALAARLVALQMAVAGSARGEVEAHLRATFELDDMTSILNDVFGTDAPRLR